MEGHRAVQFAFDDDDAELVEADVDMEEVHPGQEYDVKAQTAQLLDKIKEALNDASTSGEIVQLNNQLVDLQSQIISANASKVKAREERNKGVYETVLTAECVDLCFVIDATASMRSIILMVKDNMRTIVRQIKRTNPTLKLRLALVVYRDLFYEQRYQVLDFVDSIQEFEDFVCSIKAPKYGPHTRDIPEDMAVGIQQCNGLSWLQPTRIAYIVADSPCHGFEYHSFRDNFPLGTPDIDIKKELRVLFKNHSESSTMSVYFGQLTRATDSMIARFKHYGIFIDQVNFKFPLAIVSSVTNGVRSSVFKTATTLQSTKNVELMLPDEEKVTGADDKGIMQKSYDIIDRVLVLDEWEEIPRVPVAVYRNKPFSLVNIEMPVSVGKLCRRQSEQTRIMMLQRAPCPFAEGSTRIAYHGLLSKPGSAAPFPMILKSFKFMGLDVNDRKHYLRQMEVSNLARFLAKSFNDSSARPPQCGFVHVLPVCVIEEDDTKNEESGLRRFCAEPPLPVGAGCSKFTRFSSNTGYWAETELSQSLLAFCKYTHDATKGYLIVTDLQGVKCGHDFFLTDPVILCKNPLRFGSTNVGTDFMKRCIDSTNKYLGWNGWMTY